MSIGTTPVVPILLPDSVPGVTSWHVQVRQQDANGTYGPWQTHVHLPSSRPKYDLTGLSPGNTYQYRILDNTGNVHRTGAAFIPELQDTASPTGSCQLSEYLVLSLFLSLFLSLSLSLSLSHTHTHTKEQAGENGVLAAFVVSVACEDLTTIGIISADRMPFCNSMHKVMWHAGFADW